MPDDDNRQLSLTTTGTTNMTLDTGDVVKYINPNKSWKVGDIHIIHEKCYRRKGKHEYSTNQGAWFVESDFELIHKATKESLKQLDKDLEAEFQGD